MKYKIIGTLELKKPNKIKRYKTILIEHFMENYNCLL